MHRALLILSFFCSQLFTNTGIAQTQLIEGPHVFYADGHVTVESVFNGRPHQERLDAGKLKQVQVPIPGDTSKYFTVNLRNKLTNEPAESKPSEKVLVISDVEGNFTRFCNLLQTAGVIDADLKWTYGANKLVICGDLFDRGDEVTPYLWLLYRLEDLAKEKGGYVHVILGNHDIMNLSSDFRYVQPKYIQAATTLGRNYADFYTDQTELGRWLRTKNIMEKIGSVLYVHGGVSQEINDLGYSVKKVNSTLRPYYDKDGKDSLLQAANVDVFFYGDTSPFWYRGYFVPPLATEQQVDSTLSLFNVRRIVVGHTIVDNIRSLYKGKVIAVDVNWHEGNQQALLIEKGNYYRLKADGSKEVMVFEFK